ncbi:MAG: amino acid-binding protein [Phycisphaerae bacterium]
MSMMMNNVVRTDTQFSVFLVNKPGILARVCQQLADKKVNIVALSMMDSTEHGVLRLVAEDAEAARHALSNLDLPKQETTVLTASMPNRPGALADLVERLALDHINVHYAYCTTGSLGGKTLGVFKVSNHPRAVQILMERKPRRKEIATAIRGNGRVARRR